jgi:SAM-dependent methyltransferase
VSTIGYDTGVDRSHRDSAERMRASIERGVRDPASFRTALLGVPPTDRDEWLDRVLRLGELPEDDPQLPSGCVPYLPSSVDALLRVVEQAPVRATDVFVDVGAGLGRAGAFLHLITGASVIGLEIQPRLVLASRELAARLLVPQMSCVQGDAANLAPYITIGSIFFLYCPFSGDRLAKLVAGLEPIARTRTIRVCCVDLPIPPCPWLIPEPPFAPDLAVYRSSLCEHSFEASIDRAT